MRKGTTKMSDKIMTLHPMLGKTGIDISKQKYDLLRDTITEIVRTHGQITFTDLLNEARQKLAAEFDDTVSWYTTTVKLDLEARHILRCERGSRQQRIRLAER